MRALNNVCTELAKQIPYNHPSQLKLARFLWVVGRSHRQFKGAGTKASVVEPDMFYQNLWEDVVDNVRYPGDEDAADPARFVNYQAFMANLHDIGIWLPGSTDAVKTLNQAFSISEREGEPAAVQDAWVLGAAQWILWYGQGLFKQILCSDPPLDQSPVQDEPESSKRRGSRHATMHQWAHWKAGFRGVVGRKDTTDECIHVAANAVEMMEVLEKGMSIKST